MHQSTLTKARKILVESTVSDVDFIELCRYFMVLSDYIEMYAMEESNRDYEGMKDTDAQIVKILGTIALLGME
jgi:hypothetical protein